MDNKKQLYVTQIALTINKQEAQFTSRPMYGAVPENYKCEYEKFNDFCLDCNKKPLSMMCMVLNRIRLFSEYLIREISFSVDCDNKPRKITEKNFIGATLYVVYRVIDKDDYTLIHLANRLTAGEFFEYCKDNLHIKGD